MEPELIYELLVYHMSLELGKRKLQPVLNHYMSRLTTFTRTEVSAEIPQLIRNPKRLVSGHPGFNCRLAVVHPSSSREELRFFVQENDHCYVGA